jgi:hypothetical protein
VCKRENEDGAHIFFRCKGVRKIWLGLQLEEIRMKLLQCSGPTDMLHVLLHLDKEVMITCVAL